MEALPLSHPGLAMALMLMSTVWARDKRITLAEGLLGWAHHACCSLHTTCFMISTVRVMKDSDCLLERPLEWAVCLFAVSAYSGRL